MTNTYGPYTPLRWAGDVGFVSGQVGVEAGTKHAKADVASQARQALDNLRAVLETENLALNHTIKTTVFLKNIDDFDAVNAVYQEYFEPPRPARSCVAVASLPKIADNEILVEIEAIVCRTAPQ